MAWVVTSEAVCSPFEDEEYLTETTETEWLTLMSSFLGSLVVEATGAGLGIAVEMATMEEGVIIVSFS